MMLSRAPLRFGSISGGAVVVAIALIALSAFSAPASAQGIDRVTIVFATSDGAELERREVSVDAIEAMEPAHAVTDTPWTAEEIRFDGVLFSALAESGPGRAVEARIVALNDYGITVPAVDWQTWPLVLASRMDGVRMRVRDKGPLWLIYPLDDYPVLQQLMYHARMIWQVRSITFVVELE